MQESRALHAHQLMVAAAALALSVSVGCDTTNLRTGSNPGGGGTGGIVAADAAIDSEVASSGGVPGQDGVGTGGMVLAPVVAGGATGSNGTGGKQAVPAPGTGGLPATGAGGRWPGNGGATSPGTSGGTSLGTGGGMTSVVQVYLDQARQTMDGFGINISWSPAMSDAVADALFDTTHGLGLSILRFGMTSTGLPVSDNVLGDLKKARDRGIETIIGTCASPPDKCKDNGSEEDGGHLLPSCYDSWSDTVAAFAKEHGLYAMSIANEPDFASCGNAEPCNGSYPSTVYTADELVAFLKVAGPKLHAAGVKVIAPEASAWSRTWSDGSPCCSTPSSLHGTDPLGCGHPPTDCPPGKGYDYGHYLFKDKEAWNTLDIMGVHQYDTHEATPWPADVPERKPVWQTEAGGVQWWPEHGPSSDIGNGVAVAGWIHDAITHGEASAWLWFWYQANGTDDNLSLLLKGGTDTKRHYTLGNYSRFIRPGYVRVHTAGELSPDVRIAVFKGTDGTVVVVAINKGSTAATVAMTISGGTAPVSLTPWVTSETDNLQPQAAVPVSGANVMVTLSGKSVTTLVGK